MNAALQCRLLVLVAALGFLIAGTLCAALMSQFLAVIVLITTLDLGEVFQAHSPVLLFAIELIGCLAFTTAIVFATQSLIYKLGSGRVLLIVMGLVLTALLPLVRTVGYLIMPPYLIFGAIWFVLSLALFPVAWRVLARYRRPRPRSVGGR